MRRGKFQDWKYADKRHKWKEKVQKNAWIPFCVQTRAVRYEIVFRGIQPFFSSRRIRALGCFEPTGAATFLKKLEVHSVLYGHRKYVFKREFLCLQRFHGRFLHFDIGVKEKPQNVHLKLIFCHALTWLNLRQRIQDLVSVMRELLLGLTYEFLNKNFQEIKLFICHCSKHDRETTDRKIFRKTSDGLFPILELRLKCCFGTCSIELLFIFFWLLAI